MEFRVLWVSRNFAIGILESGERLDLGPRIRMFLRTLHQAKRFLKILVGFTLLLLGVVMIVTPGPGWLMILLALGILAAEFVWAKRLLHRLKEEGERLRSTLLDRQRVTRA
jgi:uncharacterized protein (TIGR02611 family)